MRQCKNAYTCAVKHIDGRDLALEDTSVLEAQHKGCLPPNVRINELIRRTGGDYVIRGVGCYRKNAGQFCVRDSEIPAAIRPMLISRREATL